MAHLPPPALRGGAGVGALIARQQTTPSPGSAGEDRGGGFLRMACPSTMNRWARATRIQAPPDAPAHFGATCPTPSAVYGVSFASARLAGAFGASSPRPFHPRFLLPGFATGHRSRWHSACRPLTARRPARPGAAPVRHCNDPFQNARCDRESRRCVRAS